MRILNARLRDREGLYDIRLEGGRIAAIAEQLMPPAVGCSVMR